MPKLSKTGAAKVMTPEENSVRFVVPLNSESRLIGAMLAALATLKVPIRCQWPIWAAFPTPSAENQTLGIPPFIKKLF